MEKYISESALQTLEIGKEIGKKLKKNSILCFFGDLGAGKTTLIKGIVDGVGCFNPAHVTSPTFVYLNIYRGKETIYHFDLYRMSQSDEFLAMGFDELFDAGGICCIEWSERIAELLPRCTKITMQHSNETSRVITVE